MSLKITPIKYALSYPDEHPLFGEDTLHISAQDDAGGLNITLEIVCPSDVTDEVFGSGKITLTLEEIEKINEVVEILKKEWDEI